MLKTQGNIDLEGLSEILRISDKAPNTDLGGLETQNLKNGYKLDWFSFTVNAENFNYEEILKILNYNIDDFEDIPGRYFYNSGLTLGRYVNVYFNDTNNEKKIFKNSSNTINFVFTGQGCTDLALRFDNNIYGIFEILEQFNIKVTRIDLAYDDFIKLLDFEKIKLKLNNGEFRSSKKSYNIVRSSNVKGETLGETIYIGSSRSKNGYYLRMYDKKAQYLDKDQILPDIVDITNVWQRYEISFTKSKAHEVYLYLLFDNKYKYNVDCLFKETLRNIVEFLEIKYTKNDNVDKKERWFVCKWWSDFLEFDEKVTFVNHERDVDLGRLLKWLTVSIMPNLKLLELIFNNFGYNFYQFLKNYNLNKNFSKKQERLFNNAMLLKDEQFNEYLYRYFTSKRYNDENLQEK
jgi:phage replication initiation protein